jgi:O-antigen/teichoic acid export membrane protein
LFRSASPFFDVLLLGVLYTRGGIVMLGALRDEVEVGLYAAADRLLIAPLLLPNMLNAAVYPALSRLQHTAPDQAARLARRSMLLMLALSVPLAALLYAFAPQLIQLLFGDEYLVAIPALQLLAWTVPIRGIALLLGSQLAAMNRQKEMARARLISLVAFGVLSYLLISYQGFTGLAMAVLACEILLAVLYALLIRSSSRVTS